VSSVALIMVPARHRRFLRRYSKLAIGAPNAFDCMGGFHQSIVDLGIFDGEIAPGSVEEKMLHPPRTDRNWPRHCDNCYYRFAESDRWQFFIEAVRIGE
jgi:hypothetical protein